MSTTHDGSPVDQVMAMLVESGQHSYGGEAVSQLEHALQAAMLAEDLAMDEEFIVACLLHDLGHLTPDAQDVFNDDAAGEDQRQQEGANHGAAGAHFLDSLVSDRMAWLIEQHATAKRYLCAVRPGYQDALSPDSQRSLALQGGPLDAGSAEAFSQSPFAGDAVLLRLWDDAAKVAGLETPTLASFLPLLARCARAAA